MQRKKDSRRGSRPYGFSFKVTEKTAHQIEILTLALGIRQVELMEQLIDREMQRARREATTAVKSAEKLLAVRSELQSK